MPALAPSDPPHARLARSPSSTPHNSPPSAHQPLNTIAPSIARVARRARQAAQYGAPQQARADAAPVPAGPSHAHMRGRSQSYLLTSQHRAVPCRVLKDAEHLLPCRCAPWNAVFVRRGLLVTVVVDTGHTVAAVDESHRGSALVRLTVCRARQRGTHTPIRSAASSAQASELGIRSAAPSAHTSELGIRAKLS